MWEVKGTGEYADWLKWKPTRVLVSYDGPKVFLLNDLHGEQFLAYYCDDDDTCERFLVVRFGETLLDELTRGLIDVREALSRPCGWIVDVDHDGNPACARKVQIEDLPSGVLPKHGVMLWRHLTPRVSAYAMRPASSQTIIRATFHGASAGYHCA